MTSSGGVEAAQTRAWREGDYAWSDSDTHDGGAMWSRGLSKWYELPDCIDERTDDEMTAAGAVLVATADGPVVPAEVADLRAKVDAVRALCDKAEAHRGSYAFSLFMDDEDDAPKTALIGTRAVRAALSDVADRPTDEETT